MEYYTKKFELPGRFTALNGAIQYFKVKTNAKLADGSAVAQANYLRVLEVLRSRGAQPIITSVEDEEGEEGKGLVRFTIEQPWVYGARGPMQVSAHFGEKDTDQEGKSEFAYAGLREGAIEDIKDAFKGIYALKAEGDDIVDDESTLLLADGNDAVEVVMTSGSLVADK